MKKTAAFMIATDSTCILYPPLLEDKNTDFFVLTTLHTLQSNHWNIKIIPNLPDIRHTIIESPSDFLGIYDKYIYIQNEQIVTGLLSEDSNCVVTVPPISDLLPHDMELAVPPQAPVLDNPTYAHGAYDGYPLQLSICLPMGNRCDTIGRCLEALKPLLTRVESELIVVDSSTDGSTAIAKEYADKIIPYVWCNDFSHARNTAISAASGAWILSIDDDEWFEDVEEIIDFFDSGEYLKYDAATYITRNYTAADGSIYSDFSVLRMAKNHPRLHYSCRIHEALGFDFLGTPARFKSFEAYVHHYGYTYITEEVRFAKIHRNLRGLVWDLSERPFELRLHYQLCNEVITLAEYDISAAYCFRLLSLCRLAGVTDYNAALHKNVGLVFLYTIAQKTDSLQLLLKLEPLLNWTELNSFQAATIYYLLSVTNFNNKNYLEAYGYSGNYYSLREKFLSATDKPIQTQSIAMDLLTPAGKLHSIYFMDAYSLIRLDRYEESEKHFEKIDFTLFDDEDSYKLATLMNCYSTDFFVEMLPRATVSMLKGFWLLCGYNSEAATTLYKKILAGNCHLDNLYVKFLGLLAFSFEDVSMPWGLKHEEILGFVSELSALDVHGFEDLVNDYINRWSSLRCESTMGDMAICKAFLCSCLLENLLFKRYEGQVIKDEEQYIYYFYKYVDAITLWADHAYAPNMFDTDMFKLLPSNLRGAVCFKAALDCNAGGDIRGYMNSLKLSVVECPLYKDMVKLLLKRLVEGV